MAGVRKTGSLIFRKASLFISIKAILALVMMVYAVSIVSTTRTYQGLTGGSIEVTNNLGAIDKGFAIQPLNSSATGTCSTANVTFVSSPSVASTIITANDFVYDVQVSTTGGTTPNSCFTATLTLTSTSGSPQTYGPVYMATGTVVTPGQTIDCKFDVGPQLPPSPFSFQATIQ